MILEQKKLNERFSFNFIPFFRLSFTLCFVLFFVLFFSLFANMVSAEQTYYADVGITVLNTGEIEISGLSDHPQLQVSSTQEYTSKDKAYWVLNMTFEGVFSEYLFEIHFPKDATVNYLKIPTILSMEEESGSLVITSAGSNREFHIIAQYAIQDSESSGFVLFFVGLFSFLLLLFLLYFFVFRSKYTSELEKPSYDSRTLTSRQQQILDLVFKHKGSLTQAKLQKMLDLPKASLSRNVDSLVRKGILVKERKGMSNVLFLKK